jgi:transposase
MDTPRKYVVRLTPEQRGGLTDLTRTGSAPARKLAHARVLLLADAAHPDGQRPDEYIATALGMHVNSVAKVRKRFAREGEAPALDRKPRPAPPVPPKIDGRVEAHLVAICCSKAPGGRTRWTLELLAGELVRRKLVSSVSIETVRKTLKKTPCSRGGSSAGASRSGSRPGS